MQDCGEARQIGSEQAGIAGQLLEGFGRGPKQGFVAHPFMGAKKGAKRWGHGEGEEEMRHWQLAGLLGVKPLASFVVLALGAVAIAAGAMDKVFASTVSTLIESRAELPGTTVEQGLESATFEPGQGVLSLIVGQVGAEDVS
jgi:hypothetical protein